MAELRHKEILQQFRKDLVEDIDVPVIIDHLIQTKVVPIPLKDDIMSHATRQTQVQALLDLLPRRGHSAFGEFCNALREDYPWLAEKLEATYNSAATNNIHACDDTTDLNPTFMCQSCFFNYDDDQHQPKLLPCNHGYCQECITTLAEDKHFECPECKQILDITQEIKSLPTNNFVFQSQEFIRKTQDEKEIGAVSEIVTVSPHPKPGPQIEIQISLSIPQNDLKVSLTSPDGATVYVPVKHVRNNRYKALYRAKAVGMHHVRVMTGDDIVFSGGKYDFSVFSNNPVWKLGTRGSTPGQFDTPRDLATDDEGNIYVSDGANCRVVKINSSGHYVSHFELEDKVDGKNDCIDGIAIDNNQKQIICSKGYLDDNNKLCSDFIHIYSMNGKLLQGIHKVMKKSACLAVNSKGQIIVSDLEEHALFICTRKGDEIEWKQIGQQGSGPGEFNSPYNIAIGPNDDILVSDAGNKRVQILNENGEFKYLIGGLGDEMHKFGDPSGIIVDEENNILIADYKRNVIQIFAYSGEFISSIGSESAKLDCPLGLVASSSGHVYVVDTWHHCIKKYQYK